MEFTIKSGSPEKQRSACVVVGVFDNRKLSLSAELIDRASNGYISEIIRRGDMEGKLGATLLLHSVRGTLADRVLLIGLGSLDLSAVARAMHVPYAQFKLPPGKYRARDGAHFNADGYRIVVARLLPQVEALIRAVRTAR